MPIRVVGGFKKKDLKPVPLNYQTPKLEQFTHPPTIYTSPYCHLIKKRGNGLKPQNHCCKDACLCMPLRVVGGFKKQDLQPVPLKTQTQQLDEIPTLAQYTPA